MKRLSRRQFILAAAGCLCSSAASQAGWSLFGAGDTVPTDIQGSIFKNDAPDTLWKWATPARYFQPLKSDAVLCTLCPNRCRLAPGDRSVCRSRVNLDGTLYSLAYGNACSANLDPVEKKPLFHFLPATTAFSKSRAFGTPQPACLFSLPGPGSRRAQRQGQ